MERNKRAAVEAVMLGSGVDTNWTQRKSGLLDIHRRFLSYMFLIRRPTSKNRKTFPLD
jgi:hypothetical protein